MAKKAAKKKKKSGSSGGTTGIKGFGSSPSSASSPAVGNGAAIDRSKDALAFYSYLEKNGGGDNLKRVALGSFPIGPDLTIRGVVALKPIKKGATILSIPYELALNLGREGGDPTLPAVNLLQDYCRFKSGMKSSASKNDRAAYFTMLPRFLGSDCLGSTDFFNDDALEALQSPLVVEETLGRRAKTLARYERDVEPMTHISSDLFRWDAQGTLVTEEHLRWAVWLITSRVLTVQGEAGTGEAYRLMIPLIDMCNHDRASPHILTGRAVPGGELKVVAGANVDAGEQINICYGGGVAGNDRFIQDYGFLDSFDDGTGYGIVAKQLVGKIKVMEGGKGFIPLADRDRALEALRATSIEDDKALLKSGGMSGSIRSALEFRVGVKKALAKYIVVP